MVRHTLSSLTDQVTDLLRQGIIEGRWRDTLPGRDQLAGELGCSHWTVEFAMRCLSKEGLLMSRGAGRRRKIMLSKTTPPNRSMRVMILLYEEMDRKKDYLVELLHRLQQAGHHAGFTAKCMQDLGMDVKRIARFVQQTEADAWIVVAGPYEVLEWFSNQPIPTFALFGRFTQVPLASTSPKKADAMVGLLNRLLDFGHRRIVMLVREDRRKPDPGFLECLFLNHLNERGIQTSPYNLPDWGDNPEELKRVLGSLFRHTPPTALIIGDTTLFLAAMQHLARNRIMAPEQVSLACTDYDPNFEWCLPSITHIAWDTVPMVQRVVKWAENISRGKEDLRKGATNARLVIGGTIGPVPR